MEQNANTVKLTAYSHGAGCGCKISPQVLSSILHSDIRYAVDPRLLVGNETRDDAAVFALNDELTLISTTDFFMPIVDDPFDFGGIASVNAISDIYAMGGTPILAIAILGWPVDKLAPEIAQKVLEGARAACARAGISIAGGHSIDAPEPIFGLAVNGVAHPKNIRTNTGAKPGCELYLTKPLGIGIYTTAQKRGLLLDEDFRTVRDLMLTLNKIGEDLGKLDCVKALTDVTGFGLMGHLLEMCEGSDVSAEIAFESVPTLSNLSYYLEQKTIPGGSKRNFDSYGHNIMPLTDTQRAVLCDPQTSGGLLVAVDPAGRESFLEIIRQYQLDLSPIGKLTSAGDKRIVLV